MAGFLRALRWSRPPRLARRLRRWVAAAAAVLWFGSPAPALAHAEIQIRIDALDRQIAADSTDAGLYLKRGELHRLHQNWTAAVADYQRARQLAPNLPQLDYYTGRLWLEAGAPALARGPLDRFLLAQPNHIDARIVRARVLASLGDTAAATADLDRAIAELPAPTPDLYLERARLVAGRGADYVDLALDGIDDGLARLGPLVTLALFAIEQEQARGHPQAALDRLNALPESITHGPEWQARRGDLLLALGQDAAALESYRQGLEVIEGLPATRRNTRAMQALRKRLNMALDPSDTLPP